jgi:hypothetical protein
VTTTSANIAPAAAESRNITPALAQVLVFCTLVTRVMIEPLPVKSWERKWN